MIAALTSTGEFWWMLFKTKGKTSRMQWQYFLAHLAHVIKQRPKPYHAKWHQLVWDKDSTHTYSKIHPREVQWSPIIRPTGGEKLIPVEHAFHLIKKGLRASGKLISNPSAAANLIAKTTDRVLKDKKKNLRLCIRPYREMRQILA
jgi:hypothetical protein